MHRSRCVEPLAHVVAVSACGQNSVASDLGRSLSTSAPTVVTAVRRAMRDGRSLADAFKAKIKLHVNRTRARSPDWRLCDGLRMIARASCVELRNESYLVQTIRKIGLVND